MLFSTVYRMIQVAITVLRCEPRTWLKVLRLVTNWDEYKEFYPSGEDIDIGHVYNPDMGVDEITENLSRIRGHLVEFPLNFLKEVNLQGDAIPIISDFTAELYT